jgi:hypothetical protein
MKKLNFYWVFGLIISYFLVIATQHSMYENNQLNTYIIAIFTLIIVIVTFIFIINDYKRYIAIIKDNKKLNNLRTHTIISSVSYLCFKDIPKIMETLIKEQDKEKEEKKGKKKEEKKEEKKNNIPINNIESVDFK